MFPFVPPFLGQILTHTQQFRERYKGFKIPLDSLATSNYTLVKQLGAAGTRIKAHISQAHVLKPLDDIIEFADDSSSVAETSSAAIEEGEKAAAKGKKKSQSAKVRAQEELLEALAEEEVVDGLDIGTSRVARKAAAPEKNSMLMGKFVDVIDLIPPLPDKGSFEVEDIKKSQYFFS